MALHELNRSVRALTRRPAGAAAVLVAAVLLVIVFFYGRDDHAALELVAGKARQAAEIELQSKHLATADRSCRQALAALDRVADRSRGERNYRRERAAVLELLSLVHVEGERGYRLGAGQPTLPFCEGQSAGLSELEEAG